MDKELGAATLDRMIDHRNGSEGGRKAAEKRKATNEGILKNILDTKRLTAGVITGNGVHSLSDPQFLVPYKEREKMRKEKVDKSAKTK